MFLAEWEEVKEAFHLDLESIHVFELTSDESDFYLHTGQFAFDAFAFRQFPTIEKDIKAAGRSFATGEYTGCVFFLMRATEIVTQKIASKFGVTPDWPDANQPNRREGKKAWGDFIASLEIEIGPTIATTRISDETIRTNLSHAMVASRRLKRLRNDTDHIYLLLSEFYDKDEALWIWKETKRFIEHAAKTFRKRHSPRSS